MKPDHIIQAHSSHVNKVLFSQDGATLYSMGFSGELKQWDTSDWSLIRELKGHTKSVNQGFELNEHLVTCGLDGNINFYNAQSGQLIQSVTDHKKGVGSILGTPDGRYILSSGPDRMIVVRGLDGSPERELKPNSKNIGLLAVSKDSQYVLIGGLGNKVQVFSIPELERITEIEVGEVAITCARMSSDQSAWVMDYKGVLHRIDIEKWQVLSSKQLDRNGVFGMAYLPRRKELGFACEDGVLILDSTSLEEKLVLESTAKGNYTLSVSPNEKTLALASADKRVRIWNID